MGAIFPRPPDLGMAPVREHLEPKRKPPKPSSRSHVVRQGREALSLEEAREWIAAQIPYPNLAHNEDVQTKARTYCEQQLRFFQDRTWQIRDKWRAIDYLLRGSSLSQRFSTTDIHVPELYKMVETLVPRLEEAVFNLGTGQDWFHVQGRDRMDKRKAWRIQSWLQYLLQKGKFDRLIQGMARALVIYGFYAVKSWWSMDYRDIVRRIVTEKEKSDGTLETHLQAVPIKELFYNGPKYRQVDPYDFIVDTKCPDPQESSFVGDITEMTWEEIDAAAQLGLFTNHEQLLTEEARQYDGTERQWSKIARSLDSPEHLFTTRHAKGEPRRFEVLELWCKFDPFGEGNAREYVITMANQTTVLRVQENFHDDKHRPYAIARAAREPFDFFNVGPVDHAVRINIEMDEHRNLAMKGAQNAMCPLVFADEQDELPPNIFDVEPGTVFRTQREPTFFQAPANTAQILETTDAIHRRDIEEITGAPRIYEGTSPGSDTATGVMRKIEESNRRLRSLVRSYGMGMVDLLQHTWALSAQFTTRRETFRVMGKLAANNMLGPHTDIGPEDLGDPVDFELLGLHNIHSLGLRATNMATFMNQMFPVLQLMEQREPGRIDWFELAHAQWEMMVGTLPGDRIFRRSQDVGEMLSPHEENLLIALGHEVEVHEKDDDPLHEEVHRAWLEGPEGRDASDAERRSMADHITKHQSQEQRKELQEQALQAMLARAGGAGGTEARPMGGKGRSGRSPDLAAPMLAETPPGETPGPPRSGSVPAADRDRPYPQTENRML